MSHGTFGTRTLAAILVASFCLVGMTSSAEAGWGHHRHFHRGYGFGYSFPSYRSFGFYGGYGYGYGYGFTGYRAYYPTYYRSYYRSYVPTLLCKSLHRLRLWSWLRLSTVGRVRRLLLRQFGY